MVTMMMTLIMTMTVTNFIMKKDYFTCMWLADCDTDNDNDCDELDHDERLLHLHVVGWGRSEPDPAFRHIVVLPHKISGSSRSSRRPHLTPFLLSSPSRLPYLPPSWCSPSSSRPHLPQSLISWPCSSTSRPRSRSPSEWTQTAKCELIL